MVQKSQYARFAINFAYSYPGIRSLEGNLNNAKDNVAYESKKNNNNNNNKNVHQFCYVRNNL